MLNECSFHELRGAAESLLAADFSRRVRLRVEHVQVARAAGEEHQDHGAGPARASGRRRRGRGHQTGQAQPQQAGVSRLQQLSKPAPAENTSPAVSRRASNEPADDFDRLVGDLDKKLDSGGI